MNGITNPIVFYPATIVMVLFAYLAIRFKNIFYSLLSAIIVFFIAGMFFYVLGSEFNAVIQIAIYGIAVPITLGLAIMFTDFRKDTTLTELKLKYSVICAAIILGYIIFISITLFPQLINLQLVDINSISNIQNISQGFFVNYVWAFELVSLILTITVVGLTVLKSKRRLK